MSTINDSVLIRKLLLANGHFEDDPQAHSIWSYKNDWGNWTQAVFWRSFDCDLPSSPHVHQPKLLWSKGQGLTLAGKEWLMKHGGLELRDGEYAPRKMEDDNA